MWTATHWLTLHHALKPLKSKLLYQVRNLAAVKQAVEVGHSVLIYLILMWISCGCNCTNIHINMGLQNFSSIWSVIDNFESQHGKRTHGNVVLSLSGGKQTNKDYSSYYIWDPGCYGRHKDTTHTAVCRDKIRGLQRWGQRKARG